MALVISILNASDNLTALYVFLVVLAYALLLLIPLRILFQRIFDRFLTNRSERTNQHLVTFSFLLIFLSAWITEMIGVHAIFGAFLFGLIVPRDGGFPAQRTEKLEDLVASVFLPLVCSSGGHRPPGHTHAAPAFEPAE